MHVYVSNRCMCLCVSVCHCECVSVCEFDRVCECDSKMDVCVTGCRVSV